LTFAKQPELTCKTVFTEFDSLAGKDETLCRGIEPGKPRAIPPAI